MATDRAFAKLRRADVTPQRSLPEKLSRCRCGGIRLKHLLRLTQGRLERPHADTAGCDDGEVAGPIIPRGYELCEPLSDIVWPRHRYAKQHDTAHPRQGRSPRQFAKVLVKSQQDPLLTGRPRQNVGVARPGSDGPYPSDIVPRCRDGGDCCTWEIFVGEKPHVRQRSGRSSRS